MKILNKPIGGIAKFALQLAVSAAAGVMIAALIVPAGLVSASSHMDAPLITLDPAANTTDVYAFVSTRDSKKYLTVALAVYPFEEPGIGPNNYNFDDNVLYEIHVATGDDVAAGNATISYQFRFNTTIKNRGTVLESFTGVIKDVDDANQNLSQKYTVTKVVHKNKTVKKKEPAGSSGGSTSLTPQTVVLGTGQVPPNNQGIATPLYNQGDDGNNPAKDGVSQASALDHYTSQSIVNLSDKSSSLGYFAFAGQRDDGFYADVGAIFDLAQIRNPGKDSQEGFNVHTMVLDIPVAELGGDQQVVGVYATTSRKAVKLTTRRQKTKPTAAPSNNDKFVQVGRQGNPLFNEVLVAVDDKDMYSQTSPSVDKDLFSKYAESPELAKIINSIVFKGNGPAPETGRTDLVGIFIPDLIKVDLSTGPARLAGSSATNAQNPDDAGFSRLGIFGGDTLTSTVQKGFGNGTVPGGWPNGRRFGDDVIDIALTAVLSDLRTSPPVIRGPIGDNVDHNDMGYNKVFPYAATPQNGRNHNSH